jgi:hypothetical protein
MNDPDPVEPPPQPPAPLSPVSGPSVWSERGLSDLAFLALTVLILLLCFLIARPFVTSLAWATALAVIGSGASSVVPCRQLMPRWTHTGSAGACFRPYKRLG